MNRARWLTVARTVWVVVALFYISSFLYTTPIRLSETPSFGSITEGITQAEFLAGLAQMGVSPTGYILYTQWLEVIVRFIYLALAGFIFWRKSNDWIALLTSFMFMTFLAPFDILTRSNPIWESAGEISGLLTSVMLFLWFFIFPDGRFVPRWGRWMFLVLLATQIWRIFQPEAYSQSFVFLIVSIFGSILIAQVYRYRHTTITQRQQIKWVVFGSVVGAAPLLLFGVVYFVVLRAQPPLTRAIALNFWGNFLWTLFLIEFPASLTIAIFRSRLFDIDIIIRRTLQYSILTGLLGLVYFGSVVLLQNIVGRAANEQSPLMIVVSTLLIAALFAPLRQWVQVFIDRRFYRKKYDAAQVLAQFAITARDETEMEALKAELIRVVQETMQPEKISLWLRKTSKN